VGLLRSLAAYLRLDRFGLLIVGSALVMFAVGVAGVALRGDVPNFLDFFVGLYFIILLFLVERRIRESDQREIERLRQIEDKQTELVTGIRKEMRDLVRAFEPGGRTTQVLPGEAQLIQAIKSNLERFNQEWESYERDNARRIGGRLRRDIGAIADALLQVLSSGVGIVPEEIREKTKMVAFEMRSKIADRLVYLGDHEAFESDGRAVLQQVTELQDLIKRHAEKTVF
jgi:hypothetical protein